MRAFNAVLFNLKYVIFLIPFPWLLEHRKGAQTLMIMYKKDSKLKEFTNLKDEAAFVEIYNLHWNRIYRIAKSRLNCPYEAEEVVQDIFLGLWKNRESFELAKGFENYFSIAVKNQVINRLAQKARMRGLEQEIVKKTTELDDSSLKNIHFNDLQQQIQFCLKSLSERCWTIFNLKYHQGYSQRHIAEKLVISEKTVEANLSKARKKLKAELLIMFLFSLLY